MALDGIMLAAIRDELNKRLIGGRIDKIYQINKNTLTFLIRNNNNNYRLLISADPRYSRLHITGIKFKNPEHPPDFCMLLRKYLQRSVIYKIEQPDFERILIFYLKIRNQTYFMFTEIMGRYSNISLVSKEGVIMDSLKRITEEQSKKRHLYPGIKYKYPPAQDKLNPLKAYKNEFIEQLTQNPDKTIYRAIMDNYRGISPDSAREIGYRADANYNQKICTISKNDLQKIWNAFSKYFQMIKKNKFNPVIALDNEEEIKYFSAFELTHKSGFNIRNFSSSGELFDYYYINKIKSVKYNKSQKRLKKIAQEYLTKNRKQSKKNKRLLKQAQNAEELKKKGELLKASIHQLKRGMKIIKLINYYQIEQKKISIELDPSLTPSENIEHYFKRYHKAKKSIFHIKKQLGVLKHEEKYLEQVLLNINQSENIKELELIENELIEEGYIKSRKDKKATKGEKKIMPLPPLHFKSSQGYDILVGRNNNQNDYLTKKIANRDDLWFHIKDHAGSHVIIRNHTGKEIPAETIKEAACIAAFYSKGRMSNTVPIDYTEIKNVNKPKGAKPGLVYYDNYYTIMIKPDQELVKNLKKDL